MGTLATDSRLLCRSRRVHWRQARLHLDLSIAMRPFPQQFPKYHPVQQSLSVSVSSMYTEAVVPCHSIAQATSGRKSSRVLPLLWPSPPAAFAPRSSPMENQGSRFHGFELLKGKPHACPQMLLVSYLSHEKRHPIWPPTFWQPNHNAS